MITVHKLQDLAEISHFLNGGIIGGPANKVTDGQPGIPGLVGKVLHFAAPSGSVTFAAGTEYGQFLMFPDIKAQIEAALGAGNIMVVCVNGKIGFIHPTYASAIKLPATSEVSKTLLGFPQSTVVEGKVYGADPTTPPAFLAAYAANDGSHTIFCVE